MTGSDLGISTIDADAARFRALFEHPTLAFHLLDAAGYTITINAAYTRLFGITEADWQGRSLSVFDNPRFTSPEMRPFLQRAWAGEYMVLPPYQYTPASIPTLPTPEVWVRTYLVPVLIGATLHEVIAFHEDITDRYNTRLELDHRVAFDQLLTSIVASFVNRSTAELGTTIDLALRSVGEFVGVDRAYLFLFSPSGATMTNRHEWCAPGIAAFKPRFQNRLVAALPWLIEQVQLGQPIQVVTPEQLPPAAQLERSEMQLQGVQSFVVVPLVRAGAVLGFIGFDAVRTTRRWPIWNITLMQMFSETLVHVLEREQVEATLQERELQYRSVFNKTSDALIIVEPDDDTIVRANPAACTLLGRDRLSIQGQPLTPLLPPSWPAAWGTLVRAVQAGEQRQIDALELPELRCIVNLMITPLEHSGRPHLLLIMRDVTDQMQAYELLERRVAERTRELSTLLRTVRQIGSTLELNPLLEAILVQLREVVEYDAAALLWLDSPEQLRVLHYVGPINSRRLKWRWPVDLARHAGEVVATGRPLLINDVRADDPFAAAFRDLALLQAPDLPQHVASWMGVPLLVRDRAVGMLAVEHHTLAFYTPYHADLALAFAQQAAVAIENARLFEQANTAAIMVERQRLSRELHDSVSQALYGIALGARTARTLLERDPARVREPLEYVLGLAEAALTEMRALIFELRPESLHSEGLVAALQKRVDVLRLRHGLTVETDLAVEPDVPLDIQETLYRVAQEALHNAVKHARATTVRVLLNQTLERIELRIEDDGCGFDPLDNFPGHLGLKSMSERLLLKQGGLGIDSEPGNGTRVRAWLPLSTAQRSGAGG